MGTVQDAENPDRVRHYDISCDIGRAYNDELARACHAAGAAAFRKVEKQARRRGDPFVDSDRCAWVLSLDMGEDAVAISECEGGPDELHDLASALRRAAERRLAKCASA